MLKSLLKAGALLGSVALAIPSENLYPRATCAGNTATTRSEWCEYSIDNDFWTEGPDTGVVREYWLELTDVTVAPDGIQRTAMAVNGSIPGPTLFADWGDTVKVHVKNSLSTNGTSIHFHGIRQNFTNQNDGVTSITQCPTAPGDSITYTWKASQYGSSWYHSHFGLQAWQGVFGGIIINGPASANYDEDLGMVFLNDWDKQTVDELYPQAQTQGSPTLSNGLINGTNVYGEGSSQTGRRFQMTWNAGTSYRMRLVNAAVDTHWKFSIDNHTMLVVASDLVPVKPYTTNVLDISMGQRYDIIITADQASTASSFWMRAIPQSACSDNESADNIKGIISYTANITTPTTQGYEYTDSCEDETDLVPWVPKTVAIANWNDLQDVTISQNDAGLYKWYLNSTTMLVEWAKPTLGGVLNNVSSWEADDAVVQLDEANKWVYFVIQTSMPVPHPIHLHGHDFFVLAQGTGDYSSDVTLNLDNPPRRDTAMLPSSGYLVMAWETDNPGVWLMHCHIGWHTSQGFSMQFVERYKEIKGISDGASMEQTCNAWTRFQEEHKIEQEDSGV